MCRDRPLPGGHRDRDGHSPDAYAMPQCRRGDAGSYFSPSLNETSASSCGDSQGCGWRHDPGPGLRFGWHDNPLARVGA